MPDKLKEMQELFLVEAAKYQVFPLDNSSSARILTPRPSSTAGRTVFTYSGEMTGMPERRRAEHPRQVLHHHGRGRGPAGRRRRHDRDRRRPLRRLRPLPAQGQAGVRLQPVDLERFRWEGPEALAPGKHTLVFDFKYDGPGFGKGGTGVLKVDGKEVANQKIPHTIPFLLTIDETFDVGSTPARRSTTRTTRCRSASPARSPS